MIVSTITSATLTLDEEDFNVTISVNYTVTFSPFERHLAANGLIFRAQVIVIGVDPDFGGTTGTTLHTIGIENLPVPAGTTPQTITLTPSRTVTRGSLNEDPTTVSPG